MSNNIRSGNILPAVAASGTQYTAKVDLWAIAFASIQLFWTGTIAGTWTIWVSNKAAPSEANDSDWTQLTLAASITQPAGSAGNDYVNLNEFGGRWVRAKHVKSSGSGNVEAWASGKGM
jgi:hypothetical protein